MSQALGYFHDSYPEWPHLSARPVEIGGMTVSYSQAAAALAALSGSSGIMVRQVLRAARSPLADCDYHAAAAPFREQFLFSLIRSSDSGDSRERGSWGRGAAGRPATKRAFMAAIAAALAGAEAAEPARHHAAELAAARRAFGADAGYAAAMARAAAEVLRGIHEARLRTALNAAVHCATAACGAQRGQFSCAVAAACGTGACRFAVPGLAEINVPAGPGKVARPANHGQPGKGFSVAPALAELVRRTPFSVAALAGELAGTVQVTGRDCASSADAVAA